MSIVIGIHARQDNGRQLPLWSSAREPRPQVPAAKYWLCDLSYSQCKLYHLEVVLVDLLREHIVTLQELASLPQFSTQYSHCAAPV